MKLNELNDDERIALVALLELVVASDGNVSREERSQIKHVVHGLGTDAYRAAVAAADTRFPDDAAARAFLLTISRPDARELIYETALEAAMAGTIVGAESELLTWLAAQWQLPVKFDADT